jgi:D-glycero-alpha-D-manno-heptose 1-phosphate guanylyltransferase
MKLLILAGGFGTRLKLAVDSLPKALAPVGEKPFLYLQIKHWINQGIRSFIFLLHHRSDLIIEFLQCEEKKLLAGCQVQYLIEPIPMGTGGAVAYAVEKLAINGEFLLTNADTWIGGGLMEVASATPSAAIAVVKISDASRYGRVKIDEHRYVITFEEKNNETGPDWISAGLCRLNADVFQEWNQLPFSLERVTLPKLAANGKLGAIPLETNFIDIGVPEDYFRFCRWVESGMLGKL